MLMFFFFFSGIQSKRDGVWEGRNSVSDVGQERFLVYGFRHCLCYLNILLCKCADRKPVTHKLAQQQAGSHTFRWAPVWRSLYSSVLGTAAQHCVPWEENREASEEARGSGRAEWVRLLAVYERIRVQIFRTQVKSQILP